MRIVKERGTNKTECYNGENEVVKILRFKILKRYENMVIFLRL